MTTAAFSILVSAHATAMRDQSRHENWSHWRWPDGIGTARCVFRRHGHSVTVFERERQLGGLATYHNYGPFYWDRFYHVILPTDRLLIRFLQDIGLADSLRWQSTLTGFYVDQRFHSMSSALEFLALSAGQLDRQDQDGSDDPILRAYQ